MAVAITTGAAIFKLNEESHAPVKNTQLIGIVLITVYMGTDSFTSNWQVTATSLTHLPNLAPP